MQGLLTTSDTRVQTHFMTALGWMAVAWRGERVWSLNFGRATARQARADLAGSDAEPTGQSIPVERLAPPQRELVDRLQAYADGAAVTFDEFDVDWEGCTPFQRRVLEACRAIPRGSVRTYGELAAAVGSPGAARAVGNTMAGNRLPLIIPCHRVVGAAGGLGGFSAPDGIAAKSRLLALEGARR